MQNGKRRQIGNEKKEKAFKKLVIKMRFLHSLRITINFHIQMFSTFFSNSYLIEFLQQILLAKTISVSFTS